MYDGHLLWVFVYGRLSLNATIWQILEMMSRVKKTHMLQVQHMYPCPVKLQVALVVRPSIKMPHPTSDQRNQAIHTLDSGISQ